MPRFITPILGMLMVAAVARSAEIQLPHVTVYGTATVQVVPGSDVMVSQLPNS